MRHALRSTPAESLIETIIAITVIIIGTAAALSMLRSSLDGNVLVGQKEQAINLALEGLDALKNIRDTNYLLFPADADACWKTYGATVSDCSDGTVFNASYTYYFQRDFTGTPQLGWTVRRVMTDANGFLTLYGLDVDGDGSSDMDIYAQSGITETGFSTQQQRAFRRILSLSYNDTNGDGTGTSSDSSYDATVTVYWEERGYTHSISLTRTIANVY